MSTKRVAILPLTFGDICMLDQLVATNLLFSTDSYHNDCIDKNFKKLPNHSTVHLKMIWETYMVT